MAKSAQGKNGLKLKLAVLGDSKVGKTSIVRRYIYDRFTEHYIYTNGMDLENTAVMIGDKQVFVKIVDAAGNEYCRSLIKSLYRDVHGIMVVFDVTRQKTLYSVQNWMQEIEKVNQQSPVICMVGNKTDLTSYRTVHGEEIITMSDSLAVPYYETSAKSGNGVRKAFSYLLGESWKSLVLPSPGMDISIKVHAITENKEESCCSVT